eukprot:11006343-Heterocapsa_arctica.AAC.1
MELISRENTVKRGTTKTDRKSELKQTCFAHTHELVMRSHPPPTHSKRHLHGMCVRGREATSRVRR